MRFSEAFLDELAARSDIVDVVSSYVELKRKGANYFGLCPFHSEKTPSFSVAPDKQMYHCFGCKKGGGVFNFIMEIENLTFPEAVEFLARRAGMSLPQEGEMQNDGDRLRRRVLELNRTAARWFYDQLQQPQGAAVQAYLDKRQIRRSVAVRFGMGASLDQWDALLRAMSEKGFTKKELMAAGLAVAGRGGRIYDKFRNRLMLPVIDVRGDVVGFGSRVIDNSEPKYMNTTDTPTYSKRRVLYGLNLAKKTKRPNIILCEGNLDVVTLHQAGFDNAVACMGTALTQEQIHLLSRFTKELVLCYDNDKAGQMATDRALELLENTEFKVKVLRLPQRLVDGQYVKQDADDFIKYQGRDAFEKLLSGSAIMDESRSLRVQDSMNTRIIPHVHGIAKRMAGQTYDALMEELYAVFDNPIFLPDGTALMGSNWDATAIELYCDSLAIAVMDVAKLTEVHMERLVDPHLSGLPAFLVKNPGLNNGFMIPQYVTAGLLGDIALLCAPAAAFNAAVSAGQESPVYRDDTAARQLYQAVQKLRSLVSMTMLTALQAIDLSDHKAMSPVTQKIHDHARQTVTFMENDDLMYQRIEAMEHLVESNQLLADCSVPFTI